MGNSIDLGQAKEINKSIKMIILNLLTQESKQKSSSK